MTTSRLNRKVQVALGSAIAALLIVGGISYRGMVVSRESDQWVRHTHEVLDGLKDFLFQLERMDSSHRGFVLTGRHADLASFRAGSLRVAQEAARIRTLTVDNPAQQRQLPYLESLVAQRLEDMETAIRVRQASGMAAAADSIRNDLGNRTRELQEIAGGLRAEELRLLLLRDAAAKRHLGQAKAVLILGIVLGLSIAAAGGWSFQRDNSARDEALRNSEENYRMLLDGVQDYAIVMLDPDGLVVSWNAGAGRIKGYSADEIVGRSFSCFFSPGDIEKRRPDEILRMTAESGRHEEQSVRVRKDGSRFVAHTTVTALRDSKGHLRGFSKISRDLSERRESEARYRGLLEAAPDAMVVVNALGEIVVLNAQAEKQFGYSRRELVGQQVRTLIPEGFAERLIADGLRSTEDALEQRIGTGIELTGRRKDGTAFPIEMMLSPLESDGGTLVTAAIRDITARKRAEAFLLQTVEELHRSNEELGQFAYIASHDLQEPLRMVASYTQLLSRRYAGKLDADADEFIAFAVDGASRMQTLIQDLLAYSRVGSTGKALTATSSEQALEQALANLHGAIQDSGAAITHDALPMVLADGIQLVQLFQNLVANGIKYQRVGVPRVHVSVARDGRGKCIFAVKDNGVGIEPQYFERIFGMFQRLHKREEFAGTGIGLAISKKIMERHGGSISVESQPGEGSTFRFALVASEGTV
jgi:PAS domain S-box-containing protein